MRNLLLTLLIATTFALVSCSDSKNDEPGVAGGSDEKFVGTWRIETVDDNGRPVVTIVDLNSNNSASVTAYTCKTNPCVMDFRETDNGTWEYSPDLNWLKINYKSVFEVVAWGIHENVTFNGSDQFSARNVGIEKTFVWKRSSPMEAKRFSGQYGYWKVKSFSGILRSRSFIGVDPDTDEDIYGEDWTSKAEYGTDHLNYQYLYLSQTPVSNDNKFDSFMSNSYNTVYFNHDEPISALSGGDFGYDNRWEPGASYGGFEWFKIKSSDANVLVVDYQSGWYYKDLLYSKTEGTITYERVTVY